MDDFDGPLIDSGRVIKDFGGTKTKPVKKGTIVWKWHDNNGKEHCFKIPNSYNIPEQGVRLLRPEYLAKKQTTQGRVKEQIVKQ